MWDAVTPVTSNYDPIVVESPFPVRVTVTNAGPHPIKLRAWDTRQPERQSAPESEMELRAGETRAVYGCLVRLHAITGDSDSPAATPGPHFAAIGWRIDNDWGRWLP